MKTIIGLVAALLIGCGTDEDTLWLCYYYEGAFFDCSDTDAADAARKVEQQRQEKERACRVEGYETCQQKEDNLLVIYDDDGRPIQTIKRPTK